MNLTEFLTARLDEDEAAANAGARRVGMAWRVDPEPWDGDTGIVDDLGRVANAGGRYAADHIARHDPARVLREVAAKRAILAAHKHRFEGHGDAFGCDTCHWDRDYGMPLGVEWCTTLRALAAVHSDHPDYDEAWKP